jgi:hypothetical protein
LKLNTSFLLAVAVAVDNATRTGLAVAVVLAAIFHQLFQ